METDTERAPLRSARRTGINGILGAPFATGLFRESNLHIPDDQYVNEWTAVLAARIQTHP
jgi:hypothetical protein